MPDLEQDPADRAASFDSDTSYFLVSLDLGELSRVVTLWFKFPSGFVNQLAIKAHDAICGETTNRVPRRPRGLSQNQSPCFKMA
jgi:hypothetical protein